MGSEKTCGPIIEVAVVAIKEEEICIELASCTGPTEETHFVHPVIPVHISVTMEVPVKILGVIFFLVNNHIWHEALSVSSGEYQSSTPEGVI